MIRRKGNLSCFAYRRMTLHSIVSIILLFQFYMQLHVVKAFPSAAGHCSSGDLSGKSSGHGENGGGSLSNGSLQVKFGSSALQTWTTKALNANQQYTVTIDFTTTNSNFFFRGLLFRLSGKNGEDVTGTLSVGSDNNVQLKTGCATGISAVTHTNNDDKTSVSFNFEYTESANADLLLEVTVVRQRAADNWFYSSYNLQIGNGSENVPTSSPVASGSGPTSSPVASPSSCNDSLLRFRIIKNNGRRMFRDCLWVASKSTTTRCTWDGVSAICPSTCGTCSTCVDSSSKFKLTLNGRKRNKDCSWVAKKNTTKRCSKSGVTNSCRATCGVC